MLKMTEVAIMTVFSYIPEPESSLRGLQIMNQETPEKELIDNPQQTLQGLAVYALQTFPWPQSTQIHFKISLLVYLPSDDKLPQSPNQLQTPSSHSEAVPMSILRCCSQSADPKRKAGDLEYLQFGRRAASSYISGSPQGYWP